MDPILIYGINALVYIGIFAIVALSLNAEYGYTGLANFGKVAFFMIGAYSYALLVQAGVPWPVAMVLAAVISSHLRTAGVIAGHPPARGLFSNRYAHLRRDSADFHQIRRLAGQRRLGHQHPTVFRRGQLLRWGCWMNLALVVRPVWSLLRLHAAPGQFALRPHHARPT